MGNLVLSRKVNEKIYLIRGGERIELCVFRIGPSTVRLGVKAADEWQILRDELTEPAKTTN